ncbi:DUF5017 domain-containing protein [Pedobacter frigidisoli]|uniref:DUF5017 domain-containing protein n=1 Tax=Pedobacter frigidisoli TaxID=2530455 RepID=UPI00292FD92C|nr:DUF5017 domain-containing protein [Pedobacter frigidisoli]
MKKILYISFLLSIVIMACKKEITAEAPTVDFTVRNAKSTIGDTLVFKLGDTCKFDVSGYADNIAHWSGIVGNNYDNRNRTSALGKLILTFSTTMQFGTQANTFKVLAIKNLASLDSATVVNANWTDITSRTTLATSATAVSTGNVDVTDLVSSADDVLYLAFKYSGVTGSTQRTWVISNYSLTNIGSDFSYVLSNLANDASYWTRYGNVWTPTSARWTATSSALTIVGGAATLPTNTSWIITKPLYVGRITQDIPTATVKNLASAAVTYYEYKYAAVGTYKSTFAYFSNTKDNTNAGSKNFYIKITQ